MQIKLALRLKEHGTSREWERDLDCTVHPLKMKTEWNFNILKRHIDDERQK